MDEHGIGLGREWAKLLLGFAMMKVRLQHDGLTRCK